MAPPTTAPRLRDLTPEVVAEEVCRLVLEHLGKQICALGHMLTGDELVGITPAEMVTGTDLGLTVRDLVSFAHSGDCEDWGDYLGALDALQSVCERLFSQAGVPGTFEVGEIAGVADPETPIGCVLVAATARVSIEQGADVSAKQLGALGGCTSAHLSLLARKGELERTAHGCYSATSAKRWLKARGVRGWA